MMGCCGMGIPMMLGMFLGTSLWIILLAVVIWALIRWLGSRTTPAARPEQMGAPERPSALEILQQRYARGEIDQTTFEQMRERLQASTSPGPTPWSAP